MKKSRLPSKASPADQKRAEDLLSHPAIITLPMRIRSEKCPVCLKLQYNPKFRKCGSCGFSVSMEKEIRKLQKILRSKDSEKVAQWWRNNAFILLPLHKYVSKIRSIRKKSPPDDFLTWTE